VGLAREYPGDPLTGDALGGGVKSDLRPGLTDEYPAGPGSLEYARATAPLDLNGDALPYFPDCGDAWVDLTGVF
jgi:hypothetical protein